MTVKHNHLIGIQGSLGWTTGVNILVVGNFKQEQCKLTFRNAETRHFCWITCGQIKY
jgi:hypothetical protein